VIYNMMLFSQRRDLHQSLAEQYEREGVALDPAMAPTLAFHWDRATQDRVARPACAQKAVHYYLISGRRAVSAAASREAGSAFRRALDLLPQVPDGDEKVSDTIELQLGLGALRMATHGWDDQEVAELFESAQTLCRRQGRIDPLFRILRGQWQLAIGVADYDRAHALASQLVQLAGSAELSGEALRALGTTHFWRGEFSAARDELCRALEIEHAADSSAVSLVQDTEVAIRAILAWVHAFLGDADAANQEAGAATTLAHEGLPPFSRAFAWGGAMWTGFYLNDPATARSAAVITRDLSLERGFDYLATAAHVVHGWALAALGDVEGVREVDSAITAWRHAGKAIGLPAFLVVLAKSHLLMGGVSEAHAILEDPALIRGLERELWLRPLVLGVREELARQLP
jgi:tetratricopeptide (TPR) repeat protein